MPWNSIDLLNSIPLLFTYGFLMISGGEEKLISLNLLNIRREIWKGSISRVASQVAKQFKTNFLGMRKFQENLKIECRYSLVHSVASKIKFW